MLIYLHSVGIIHRIEGDPPFKASATSPSKSCPDPALSVSH
jgi:hypothetical protein